MISHQVSSAILGTALGLTILLLVRRDHLQLGRALFWLAFAAGSIVFGLVPGFSDRIAHALGISYGPTLVILIALAALVIRSLQADIHATRLERSVRRLTQKIAVFEADLATSRESAASDSKAGNTMKCSAPGSAVRTGTDD